MDTLEENFNTPIGECVGEDTETTLFTEEGGTPPDEEEEAVES